MGKFKNKIFIGLVISVLLVLAFLYGGNIPSVENSQINENVTTTKNEISDNENKQLNQNDIYIPANEAKTIIQSETVKENITVKDNDNDKTEPVNSVKNELKNYENKKVINNEHNRKLYLRCYTILNNINLLSKEKADIIPKDGIIFPEKTVVFYKGESVFNILRREMKQSKIHLEFVNVPVYNSAYIEGIGNLYEFDCGELSGWMYKVNDWFPNYGCSRYELKDGDRVEWVYTCDLGKDVGGQYSARNGKQNE